MSTYGTMQQQKEVNRSLSEKEDHQKVSFKLTKTFNNHFVGHHTVDDNNKQRM